MKYRRRVRRRDFASSVLRSFPCINDRSGICLIASLHAVALPGTRGPCKGEESVFANLGREGEIAAGIGKVRSLALLSNLRDIYLLSMTCGPLGFLDFKIFSATCLPLIVSTYCGLVRRDRSFSFKIIWRSLLGCSRSLWLWQQDNSRVAEWRNDRAADFLQGIRATSLTRPSGSAIL
jgi:hypothetical protein